MVADVLGTTSGDDRKRGERKLSKRKRTSGTSGCTTLDVGNADGPVGVDDEDDFAESSTEAGVGR